ncbi:MAG: universal stress protein [Pseudorhodobacter sp.]
MAYKSILTVLSSQSRAERIFTAAADLAVAQDAHLEALCLGFDRVQVGYSYIEAGAALLEANHERAKEDALAVEAAAKKAAASQPESLRCTIETAVTMPGSTTELIGPRSRFSDLLILDKPYGKGRLPEEEAITEAGLFEGRAPVLMLPEGSAVTKPKCIVLAWNQSEEATVAARRALPFMRQAENVVITVIDPPKHGPERSDPGGPLCKLLSHHGVRAEVSVLTKTKPRVSDVLLGQIQDRNADLLVMGAYGHSRFREAILGGATRNILEQADIPVLMAH